MLLRTYRHFNKQRLLIRRLAIALVYSFTQARLRLMLEGKKPDTEGLLVQYGPVRIIAISKKP